jgi:hypothetical protein
MRDLLLGSVVAKFVALGFGEDAEKGGVAICNPVSESIAADKDGQSSKDGVEEIEGADGGDAHQVKQRALYTQISEGLMQALENAVRSGFLLLCICHRPPVGERWNVNNDLAGRGD